MIIDILTLVATAALAFAAAMIAKQANSIADRSVRVEADKHIFEWGQRCLNCLSRISSLRLVGEKDITPKEFVERRRGLRAELFALREEGCLFFEKNTEELTADAILALDAVCDVTDGTKFKAPVADDYIKVRSKQNGKIRDQVRAFIEAVQSQVGNEWLAR